MTVSSGLTRPAFEQAAQTTWRQQTEANINRKEKATPLTKEELDLLWREYQVTGELGDTRLTQQIYYVRAGGNAPAPERMDEAKTEIAQLEAKKSGQSAPAEEQKAAQTAPTSTPSPVASATSGVELTPDQEAIIKSLPPEQQAGARAIMAQQKAPEDYSAYFGDFDPSAPIYVETGSGKMRTRDPERGRGGIVGNQPVNDIQRVDKPAGSVLKGLWTMTPEELGETQRTLFENGWYPEGVTLEDVQMGRVDTATQQAYISAMQQSQRYNGANDQKLTLTQIIAMGDPDAKAKAKKAKKQGIVTQTTNPIATREAAREKGLTMTGVALSAADQQAFADYYRQQEEVANAAQRKASAAGEGDLVGAPPIDDAAAAWLREKDPAGVHGFGMLSRYNEFMSMLSSAS